MLKKNTVTFFLVLHSVISFAQFTISGTITNLDDGSPLPGANITLDQNFLVAISGADGGYLINKIKSGKHTLTVSYIGFKTVTIDLNIDSDLNQDIALQPEVYLSEEVIISAIRADGGVPTTISNLDASQIERNNTGRDLPYLLESLPSTVVTSDAGNGIGYSGIRIRGTDLSGINVTLNGVPVNDGESQGVYFVDLPDLASSIDDIKVQRGVGASSNGAASFGASINIKTGEFSSDPYGEISSAAGSFSTFKNTLKFGSGMIRDKWAFDGRISMITSDGYIERATSNLKSFYASGGYYGKKDVFKMIVLGGSEKTYQAWNGTPKDSLSTNRRYNPSGAILDTEGNIVGYYKNETDNYDQTYYQMHYAHEFSNILNIAASGFYTRGIGYYESYKNNQSFAQYGWNDTIIGNDTVSETSLIQQKWLDNHFYGINLSLNYSPTKWNINIGGGWNTYDGDHYGYVTWAQVARLGEYDTPWYSNTGTKITYHVFAKATYSINEKLSVYGDLLFRGIDYKIKGTHDDLSILTQSHQYQFLNPKLGLSYNVDFKNSLFLYAGIANREPNRSVFRDAEEWQQIEPEKLTDFEFGYQFTNNFLSIEANAFYMLYKNQFVLTGQINDVGSPIMTNVPKSYRRGIELSGIVEFLKIMSWQMNATYSQNKIENFVSYTDNWDTWPVQVIDTLGSTNISFSPEFTFSGNLSVQPAKGLTISLVSNYISRQYIDNTSSKNRSLDPYLINDLKFFYTIKTGFIKQVDVWVSLNNIFNVKYESNAWVYNYYYENVEHELNGYFSQAQFNFMAGLNLKF